MIKNMTRKGLAIGAGVSLMLTGLVGIAPAQAAGIEGFVDLKPQTGIETGYAVIANDGAVFAVTAAGRGLANRADVDIKLLVQDPTQRVTADAETRAADGSFVLNIGTADAARNKTLTLTSGATSVTVTVQAFVDMNGDDKIDAGDYVSPAHEITFVTRGDLRAQATLAVPQVGDATLSATVITTPVLNWVQVNGAVADELLAVVFNRQDSVINGAVKFTSADTQRLDGSLAKTITMSSVNNAISGWNATSGAIAANEKWGFTRPVGVSGTTDITRIDIAVNRTVTVTTAANHNLRTGDKITMVAAEAEANAADRTVTVVSSTVFTYTTTGAVLSEAKTNSTRTASTAYTVETYDSNNAVVDRVFGGTHSAVAAIRTGAAADNVWTPRGTASSFAAQLAVADDVELATVASANVQGAVATNLGSASADVRAGTTAATVVATIVDEEGDAVGAGVLVSWNFDVGTATTIRINGLASAANAPRTPAFTDANGQVTFNVTDTNGSAGKSLTLEVEAPGASKSVIQLDWKAATIGMYDLSVSDSSPLSGTATRTVLRGSSYTMQLLVSDQWFTPVADGDYQLAVSGTGATSGFVAVTGGRASLTVTDSGVVNSYTTTITLQLKGATGVFANTTTTVDVTTNVVTTARVTLGANGSALFAGETVKLSSAVAEKALVERDQRTAFTLRPDYENNALIAGAVTAPTTGVAQAHAVVTVSGPTSILFSNGAVDARGSITVVADSSGHFAVTLYSTTAQEDTVITVTANGASSTTKVTFTGLGVGEGTAVTITAPSNVQPASTFQVKAKLSDAFGNGVTATDRFRVTYTGPGIVFGTLPTSTDANGELMFSVLLGANDTGTITVRVQYDKNGNGVYTDAVDLSATSTITIGDVVAGVGTARAWTKDMGDGTIKMYARDLVGQGKVTFYHNGNEVAWIRAVDATDPKLNVASDGMVRTRALVSGRNVFEIKVNGVQLVRRIATGS